MKFSKLWLEELLRFKVTSENLVQQLTMVGLEVAGLKAVAGEFSGVVVGEVLAVVPHPDANKLKVCRVAVGNLSSGELNIVCGAPNVRVGLKAPLALIGAVLPGNLKIKKSRIRGVDSEGMLCSGAELGLLEHNPGLLELREDAPVGYDIRHYLILDDEIIEVELTSNRGDCLSISGIAREVAALNQQKLSLPDLFALSITKNDIFAVTVLAKEFCPYYCGRVIKQVNNRLLTPIWVQERLIRSGLHPINLIVDLANYVMLELGQPLHAFNLAQLSERVEVRLARENEKIILLDESKISLTSETLIIADAKGPLAIAGVMGGKGSGVFDDTVDLFLESAFFHPEKIALAARYYNLSTDSSFRFERGVDYNLQRKALERLTALIVETAGGVVGEITEIISKEFLPKKSEIILHRDILKKVIGIAIDDDRVEAILCGLGMALVNIDSGWQVTVPSFRFDLKIEVDLVEEIARVYGYHQIPEQEITASLIIDQPATKRELKNRLDQLMVDLGYHEVITYSFIDKKLQDLFDPKAQALVLANPISTEMSVMRTTLWPGIINVVKYNAKRQKERGRFYEIGLRFLPEENLLMQDSLISGVTFGELYPKQWGVESKVAGDFFDIKNDVNRLLKLFAFGHKIKYLPLIYPHPALHPLRSAAICIDDKFLGLVGELHPSLQQELELTKKVNLFELNLSILISELKPVFKKISKFPKITRDIAITVAKKNSWKEIRDKIVDISGDLLQNIVLFDIYYNENIGLDKHSMAIHLVFQSSERTLLDAEVDSLLSKVVLALEKTFNASLRG